MMRRVYGIGVTLLLASAALCANPSGASDVRRLVESSLAATQRHWQQRLHYTYLERDE